MSEDWDGLSGGKLPSGWSDVKDVLHKAAQANLILFDKKSSGHVSEVAQQLWNNCGEDPDKVISFINSTLKGRKSEKYLLGGSDSNFRKNKPFQPNKPTQISAFKEESKQVQSNGNWDKVYYDEYEHWTWKDPRHWPAKLWSELSHKFPRPYDRKIYIDGHSYLLEAGTVIITERQLARNYSTTKTQIHTLLVKLENDKMISRSPIAKWKKQQPLPGPDDGPDDGPREQPRAQPRDWLSVTLVTITNYWKYHTKIVLEESTMQPSERPSGQPLPGPLPGPDDGPQIIEYINKEIENKEKPPTPLRGIELYDIWEKERGSLFTVRVREPEKLEPFLEQINKLQGDPRDRAREIIQEMKKAHPDHIAKMKLIYFAKDPGRLDKLMDGDYRESWEKENGRAGKIRTSGKGDAKDFGFKGGRIRRVDTLDDSEVSEMQ
jgi:hypothetical protein